MSETCHYCHEPITRHEDVIDVMDEDDQGNPRDRTYHDDCHRLVIYEHRDRGERLPEDRPMPNAEIVAQAIRRLGASGAISAEDADRIARGHVDRVRTGRPQ